MFFPSIAEFSLIELNDLFKKVCDAQDRAYARAIKEKAMHVDNSFGIPMIVVTYKPYNRLCQQLTEIFNERERRGIN